jgi:hypothetical protein
MLDLFLEKVGGYFDRRFILSIWFPIFLFGAVGLIVGVAVTGFQSVFDAWDALSPMAQAWLGVGGLLVITFLAYLGENFIDSIVRFYEGYWPDWLGWATRRRIAAKRRRWEDLQTRLDRLYDHEIPRTPSSPTLGDEERDRLKAEYDHLYFEMYHRYPRDPARLMPTRLGNVLRSAEEYSKLAYNVDAPLVWSRLVHYLPEAFTTRMGQATTSLVAMLVCATLSFLFAPIVGLILVWGDLPWYDVLGAIILSVALGVLCYHSAVIRAVEYGTFIRTAFDLHREEVLKALHIPLPSSPLAEWKLWPQLLNWWYAYAPPFDPEGDRPAWYYEDREPKRGGSKPEEHVLYLKLGLPPDQPSNDQ